MKTFTWYQLVMSAFAPMVLGFVLTGVGSAQAQTFSFGAAGDHAANSRTEATFQQIRQEELDFFLSLGDLGYGQDWAGSDPQLPAEEAWCNGVKDPDRLGSEYPIQLIVGNHEDDWSRQCRPHQGHISNYIQCLPEPASLRLNDEGEYGAQYYFDYPRDYPIARILMLGAGLQVNGHRYDYQENDPDYNWVVDKMQEARERGIPWIIVGMHEPCMTMGSKTCRHTPSVQAGCDVGGELVDLSPLYDLLLGKVDGLKADLILTGDDHNYQRSHQLMLSDGCPGVRHDDTANFSACVADNSSNGEYVKGNGPVFVVAGTGGIGLRNLNLNDKDRPFFAAWNDDVWGFLRVDVSRQQLQGRYVRSAGQSFTDSFKIVNPARLVDFDDLPEGTGISDQYAADLGVSFDISRGDNGFPVVEEATANPDRFVGMSPPNIMVGTGYAPGPGGSWNCHEDFQMDFDPPVTAVSIQVFAMWFADAAGPSSVRMIARDTSGDEVDRFDFVAPPPARFFDERTVALRVAAASPRIASVVIENQEICVAFDNLAIRGPSPNDPMPPEEWVAYNDMNVAGEPNAANVTGHPYPGGGNLLDFDSGMPLPVTIENTVEGGTACERPVGSTGGNAASGTDAGLVFGGIVNLQGMDELEEPECKARITLRNLDPSKFYRVTLTANRDNPSNNNARYTRVTIEDADAFTQNSSSGVVVNGENSVSFSTGFNRDNGYVASWNDVKSGSNGRFSIVSEWDPTLGSGSANTQGYAMAALQLEQINDPGVPPSSGWVAYNDMLQAGDANADNVTDYIYSETGPLMNFNTGAALPVTVRGRIDTVGGDLAPCQLPTPNTGDNTDANTDAAEVFEDVVNLQGMHELEDEGCRAHIEFSGLDPSKSYTVTLTANRDNASYDNARFTRVTIAGADDFTQASSSGVVVNSEASVSFSTGYNTVNGYVARWTGVRATDGAFEIVSQWDSSRGSGSRNTQGYGMAAFRLEEHP